MRLLKRQLPMLFRLRKKINIIHRIMSGNIKKHNKRNYECERKKATPHVNEVARKY